MTVRGLIAAVHFVKNHPVAAAKLAQRSGAGGADGAAPPETPEAKVKYGNQESGGGGIKTGNEIGFDG